MDTKREEDPGSYGLMHQLIARIEKISKYPGQIISMAKLAEYFVWASERIEQGKDEYRLRGNG